MFGTFWALVPPIIAIALALITKEVYSSLFIGAVAGALFYAGFHVEALDSLLNDGVVAAISDNAGIFMFLVLLGILVALLNKAGGSAAFGAWAKAHIKTRGGAMFSSFLLGVLIFVDDYFNCLTVGSVMRPVTDSHNVSRAKLAYIIDSTAAPICMIAPISSWAAAVSGVVEDYSGFDLFIRAIPFNFYSLLTIVMVLFLCKTGMDYGPMRRHELNAIRNNDLFTEGEQPEAVEEVTNPRARVIDLLLPIIVLVVLCVGGLVYSGYLNGADNFIDAFANCDAFFGLPWGAIVALVFTVIYFVLRRVISFKDAMSCIPQGFCAMVPAILILTLATSLKNMTTLLGAKEFVAGLMHSASSSLYSLLPACSSSVLPEDLFVFFPPPNKPDVKKIARASIIRTAYRIVLNFLFFSSASASTANIEFPFFIYISALLFSPFRTFFRCPKGILTAFFVHPVLHDATIAATSAAIAAARAKLISFIAPPAIPPFAPPSGSKASAIAAAVAAAISLRNTFSIFPPSANVFKEH